MWCPVNTFAKSFDFSEDRIRCGCPDERLRIAVGILDVAIDFCGQFLDAAKGSPAKISLCDAIEPDLQPKLPVMRLYQGRKNYVRNHSWLENQGLGATAERLLHLTAFMMFRGPQALKDFKEPYSFA